MPVISFGVECADWRVALRKAMLASMASYEYRVTEAADGTFPVELWRSGEGGRCIYKTTGFQTRELAEAWIVPATEVPVEVQSDDPPSPRGRVIYIKPPSS
jgi:hypothetical protein